MMRFGDRKRSAVHEQSWELLPWFVNGTLDEAAAQRIQDHLAECRSCRDEVANQTSLRQHMWADEAVLHTPHASLQKLLAKMDQAEEQRRRAEAASATRRPRRMDRSRWLAVAVVAEAACLVMLIGMLTWKTSQERNAPRYMTLTTPETVTTQAAARVVFAPELSVAQLHELLRAYDARIVAGPTEASVFTVTLRATLSEAEVAATIERLQHDPRVRFAQPAPGTAR